MGKVRSHRIDGNLVILEMAISLNLTSLTVEEVIHKRKKLLRDLSDQIQASRVTGVKGVKGVTGVDQIQARPCN